MQLLFSSDVPAFLLPALPFAYFTQAFDYVAALSLRNSTPDEQPTKYYFRPHLDEIKQKFIEVKALGAATAEEWFKGLSNSGKEKLVDASRWEQWEASDGLHDLLKWRDLPLEIPTTETHETPTVNPTLIGNSALPQFPRATSIPLNQPVMARPPGLMQNIRKLSIIKESTPKSRLGADLNNSPAVPSTLPPKPQTPNLSLNSQNPPQPQPIQSITPIQPHVPQPRTERSIKDVNEAKASRRADIERRCAELEPPITPSVLIHMDSFAAAIQIPLPLNDNSWEVLKPRLLAQRETAEQREQEQRMQSQMLQRMTEERRQQEASLKESKEILDREWDESQKPVREKVNIYADEIIQTQWRGGHAVTKELCPKFAADVLVYVRERFYHVQQQEDAMTVAAGRVPRQDLPNAAPTRTLILENMKSVFDTKIKPFTEHHQKEIFLCSACDTTAKWYGFEGVIQHFAAKHTSSLSSGTIVVWWRAEWPEIPPFNPNPTPSRGLYGNISGGGSEAPASLSASALPIPYMLSASNDRPPKPGQSSLNYVSSQGHPNNYYGYLSSSESPSSVPFASTQYQNWSYASSPPGIYNGAPPPDLRPGPYQQTHPNSYPQYSSFSNSGYPPADQQLHPPYSSVPQYHSRSSLPSYTPQSQKVQLQAGYKMPAHLGASGQPFGIYQVQLEELSRNAREVWDGTSGIHGLPSSVRIHVIINHVVLRFKDRFTNEPNLALFTDGLNNSSQMKPIRNLSDLTCKSCAMTAGNLDSFSRPGGPPPAHSKLHTLPALLAHFQAVHIEQNRLQIVPQTGIEPPRLDWKFDMVQLPEASQIKDLIHAPGMDNAKLSLIAAVLPAMFPNPLPKIDPPIRQAIMPSPIIGNNPGFNGATNGTGSSHTSYPATSETHAPYHSSDRTHGLEVAVDNFPKFIESPMHNSAEPIEPAKDDEYDPHRPAYIDPPRDKFGRIEHHRLRLKQSPLRRMAPQVSENSLSIEGQVIQDSSLMHGQVAHPPPIESAAGSDSKHRPDTYPGHGAAVDRSNPDAAPVSRPDSNILHSSEAISAAEHFLNNFDPTDDRDEIKPITETSNTEHTLNRSVQTTPSPAGQQHTVFSHRLSPPARESDHREVYVRADDRNYASTSRRKDDILRDPGQYHYVRNDYNYAEPRYVVDPEPRRSSSRFDRYEAQRQGSQQPRSNSPYPAEPASNAAVYYRERSPSHSQYQRRLYSVQPPIDLQDEYGATDDQPYARVPASRQYQYVDGTRYAEPYDGPVEYVRVAPRESSAPGTFYMERKPQNSLGNEYERDYRRGDYIEHNGQLYTRTPHPAERQESYPPRVRYM